MCKICEESVIANTNRFIIRMREERDQVTLFLHFKDLEGRELLPNGYVLGNTSLIHKLDKNRSELKG